MENNSFHGISFDEGDLENKSSVNGQVAPEVSDSKKTAVKRICVPMSEDRKKEIETAKREKKLKTDKIIRDIAHLSFRLGEDVSKRVDLSRERAKIISSIKGLDKRIAYAMNRIREMEKEKVQLLK